MPKLVRENVCRVERAGLHLVRLVCGSREYDASDVRPTWDIILPAAQVRLLRQRNIGEWSVLVNGTTDAHVLLGGADAAVEAVKLLDELLSG